MSRPSPVLLQGSQKYRQHWIAKEEGMETSHGKAGKNQGLKKKAQAKLGGAGSGNQMKSLRKSGLQLQKPLKRYNGGS